MERVNASDYHELVRVSDPQVAPTGDRVAFVRTTPEDDEADEATVYVVPVGGGDPRQFTVAEGVDSQPRWSPNGDFLAFASTRGDDDRTQLWVLPVDGGEARQVTDVPGGVQDLAWSPDGDRIAFVQRTTADERESGLDCALDDEYERETPDPRVIDRLVYRAAETYFDDTRSHVYLADRDGGGVERVTGGEFDFVAPTWGDASTLYYAVKRGPTPDDSVRWDIEAADLATGETERVTQTTAWQPLLAATADGLVAYTWTPEDRLSMRQTEVKVHDTERGQTVTLTETLDRTVDAEVGLEWDPAGERVYFATPDEGSVVLRRAPGDGSGPPETVFPDRHVDGFGVGRDVVAVTASEWDHPGDVFATTPGGAEETRLTRVNADYLDGRAVSQPEERRFETDDGVEVQGWVLTPPDADAGEQYPLAVEVHGGPHAMWSTAGTMWHEFQTLAARGYVVFWCNPRGSTGYGEEHAMAIERDWGAVTARDVLAGVDRVVDREDVDESEQFLTGGSFGGFMTAWLVGHTDRFRAAVAQRGVYDLATFYGTSDAFRLVEDDFGATPWEDAAFLWEQSPIATANRVTTPTLVVHSDDDYRVPVDNGELLFQALKKHGVDTRLVRYPDEGHELSRGGGPRHVVDRIERIVRWFDGYSDRADVPPALERGDDGLSTAAEDDAGR